MDDKSFANFLKLFFDSFFRWWWAVFTGVASIASFLFTPAKGILIRRFDFCILTLFAFILMFLVLSIIYQGWCLYKRCFNGIKLVYLQRNNLYESEYICILESDLSLPQASLLEMKRFIDNAEVTIALIEIVEKNSKGQYQARTIWTSPGHFRDFRLGRYSYKDIFVDSLISINIIRTANNNLMQLRGERIDG